MVTNDDIKKPWAYSAAELLDQLQSNADSGLSSAEAASRLTSCGYNTIHTGQSVSPLTIFLRQFVSPFALLLMLAASFSFFFEEWLDGIAILLVLVLNTTVGFVMEFQAARAIHALKKMTAIHARVLRNGSLISIPAEQVVPGDILFVEGGDLVSADLRLISCFQLQSDESSLTGESLPVEKNTAVLPSHTIVPDRTNMLFKGSFVTRGNGYGLAVYTGMSTELGKIAGMIHQVQPEASPLEKKLQVFSKKLVLITLILMAFIFLAGWLQGKPLFNILQTSIALSVAAIPEGLPVVATMALALGMMRMARQHILAKRLSLVETLGSTNIICTDKTGTLTENQMEVACVQLPGMEVPAGIQHHSLLSADPAFAHLQQIAVLCNTASLDTGDGSSPGTPTGDPLEISLLKMASFTTDFRKLRNQYPKIDEIPFSSDLRVMATLHKKENGYYVAVKGAMEALLNSCDTVLKNGTTEALIPGRKNNWLKIAEKMAASGLRTLAFAFKESPDPSTDLLSGLTLAGIAGFSDPVRPEVISAIGECQSAGIRVVMVTGDHPATAREIARQVGLPSHEHDIIHGDAMKPYAGLTIDEKQKWLSATVFARVTPEQKLDLVRLYQEQKMIVGMTGDGVNDAPALTKADIGIAMGRRGTQVAQEVADMILTDDAFSSIVSAIKQGRTIFSNIRRFVVYLLSGNLSELVIIATASLLNLPFQLFPLQILYINLITDVLPALALGMTKAPPFIMQRKPYASQTPIVDRKRWIAIFTYASIMTLTTISAVYIACYLLSSDITPPAGHANNMLFYTLAFSQVVHVLNMSFDLHSGFFKSSVFTNKYVWYAIICCISLTLASWWVPIFRKALNISFMDWKYWTVAVIAALCSLVLIQWAKRMRWIL
ncbi:Ca2+-transporting ATPase [Chitinophaga eiseniae]|uniref:P-type Cu(+) transporter n=2 Tax=Chitinophaga eiseniae TaxID=634771 RepID=A0A1T4MEQ7_9BACT|nr:Ca2+-transporting ATPase [Chitinophaga eiseniae]